MKKEDYVILGLVGLFIASQLFRPTTIAEEVAEEVEVAQKYVTTFKYSLVMVDSDYYCIPEGSEAIVGRVLRTGLSYEECNNLISSLYMI
jgi:hypothetical protein